MAQIIANFLSTHHRIREGKLVPTSEFSRLFFQPGCLAAWLVFILKLPGNLPHLFVARKVDDHEVKHILKKNR